MTRGGGGGGDTFGVAVGMLAWHSEAGEGESVPYLWPQPPRPGDPACLLGLSPEGLGEQADPGVLWSQSWSCPLGLSSVLCEAEPQNLACVAVNTEHTPGKGLLTRTWGFGSFG